MLILKLNKEKDVIKKPKVFFRRKNRANITKEFNRYSINVNGKNVPVLELDENDLSCEEVTKLLRVYKGRVLVAKEYGNNEILKNYLFDPKKYYQQALLSSLNKQIKTVNREWKYIVVKINDFSPFNELFEVVKISKKVKLITQKNAKTINFVNECYNEYGAIVSIDGKATSESGVFLDLDKVDSNGKLMISINGKGFLLYPDSLYFQGKEEYKKLIPFGIEHNLICAAFSDK